MSFDSNQEFVLLASGQQRQSTADKVITRQNSTFIGDLNVVQVATSVSDESSSLTLGFLQAAPDHQVHHTHAHNLLLSKTGAGHIGSNRFESVHTEDRFTARRSGSSGCKRSINTLLAMYNSGDFFSESPLCGVGLIRIGFHFGFNAMNFGQRHEGEPLHEGYNVVIGGGKQVLIKLIRSKLVTRKPDGTTFALSKFFAVGSGKQRESDAVQGAGTNLSGQFSSSGDVTPLVGASQLQGALQGVAEMHKIVRLQKLVGELCKTDSVVARQARLDRVLCNHGIDSGVLANVAQKLQKGHLADPVIIVEHHKGLHAKCGRAAHVAGGAIQNVGEIGLDGSQVGCNGLIGKDGSFCTLAAGITHPGGGAAQQGDDAMAAALEPCQGDDGEEVSQMQGVGGGIKAGVDGERLVA